MKGAIQMRFRAAILLFALIPTGALAQGTQEPLSLEKTITKVIRVKYLQYLPKEYGKDSTKKWPMILFLHGAGESGDNLELVKKHGPPKLAAEGRELPFVIISPQSPGGGWNTESLDTLLNELPS